MKTLNTLHNLVYYFLSKDPKARNSDNYLYLLVLQDIGRENGVDINSMAMPTFLLKMKEYGFPSIESVGRARRKVQELHPELSSDTEVAAAKELKEEEFKSYSRRVW